MTESVLSPAPDDEATIATTAEVMAALLGDSKRRSQRIPVARQFMTGKIKPTPFAQFVSAGRDSALDQYLLLLAMAASDNPTMTRHNERIARALGFTEGAKRESARKRVRANWRWLEERNLIKIEAGSGRSSPLITLLASDGSRGVFEPQPRGKGGGYFAVPYAYFLDGWYRSLRPRAKAALLICLNNTSSTKRSFELPAERGAAWYGIAPDTFERGTKDLRELGLLDVKTRWGKSARSPSGTMEVNCYTLKGAFAPPPTKPAGPITTTTAPTTTAPASTAPAPTSGDKP